MLINSPDHPKLIEKLIAGIFDDFEEGDFDNDDLFYYDPSESRTHKKRMSGAQRRKGYDKERRTLDKGKKPRKIQEIEPVKIKLKKDEKIERRKITRKENRALRAERRVNKITKMERRLFKRLESERLTQLESERLIRLENERLIRLEKERVKRMERIKSKNIEPENVRVDRSKKQRLSTMLRRIKNKKK